MFTSLPAAGRAVMPTSTIDLTGGWDTIWGAVSSTDPTFFKVMTVVAVALLIGALIGFAWKKRNGGGNTKPLLWTIVVAAILAGPQVIIPIVLNIIEVLIDLIANIGGGATS